MNAPESIETARLLLRRPASSDAEAIFSRYASDPAVTRYMSWPTHSSLADTEDFLQFCAAEWEMRKCGAYLIFQKDEGGLGGRAGELLGSTGLHLETSHNETPRNAVTGYVLARDAWGRGYATEALTAMVQIARQTGVKCLEASCHPDHHSSAHVLEKCGFQCEGIRRARVRFPNLPGEGLSDVLSYALGL